MNFRFQKKVIDGEFNLDIAFRCSVETLDDKEKLAEHVGKVIAQELHVSDLTCQL